MKRIPGIIVMFVFFVMACASYGADLLGPASAYVPRLIDPAAAYGPRLVLSDPTALQVSVGPVNPTPAALNIPVNYSPIVAFNQTNGKWKVASVIGAIGADIWVQPISAQWSTAQTGWGGGTINGGAALGTGAGLYYQTTKGSLSGVKVGVSGGVDSVSGQKAGLYAGLSIIGTLKF